MDEDILRKLEERLGPLRARQRMGIERDREAQIFGKGIGGANPSRISGLRLIPGRRPKDTC
jgi:hypothetical protein